MLHLNVFRKSCKHSGCYYIIIEFWKSSLFVVHEDYNWSSVYLIKTIQDFNHFYRQYHYSQLVILKKISLKVLFIYLFSDSIYIKLWVW